MLFAGPSNISYKKMHKPILKYAVSSVIPKFGMVGLQAMSVGKLNAKALETGSRVISRQLKKKGLMKINVFPSSSLTKKTVGARMGKGKGKHYKWVSLVQPGKVIYELMSMKRVALPVVFDVMRKKLSVRSSVVKTVF